MRAATFVAAAIGAVALATAPLASGGMDMGSHAGGAPVSILYGSVTPVKVDVLAGEPVDWSNDSVRDHTITADDGSYDSGTLRANGHYSRAFDTDGVYAYHCRLHPYIRGEVDVHELLLDRPSAPGASGRPYPLTGRAALASGTGVAIESDSGDGWHHVADATVGAGGSFSAQVSPSGSASYRAVSGGEQSPSVDLLVLDRSVSASVRNGKITTSVAPASPGATVVLQLYLKERFGWWPVATHKLDKGSRTTFTPPQRAVRARVVLTLPNGGTTLATSGVLKLGRVQQRTKPAPHMPMHH